VEGKRGRGVRCILNVKGRKKGGCRVRVPLEITIRGGGKVEGRVKVGDRALERNP